MFDWLVNGLKSVGHNIGQNRDLFAQYLAAAGSDLQQMGGLGPNVNAVTQQHIQNKNFRDMFAEIMKQGGKMTAGDGKMKFELPFNTPGTPGSNPTNNPGAGPVNSQTGVAPVMGDSPMPTLPNMQDVIQRMGGYLGGNSPFSVDLSGLSNNALAGLTPELMMAVVNTKLKQGELGERSITDLANIIYNNRMAGVAEAGIPISQMNADTAQLNAYRQLADEFRQSPIEVPGLGTIDLKQFSALPDKTKAYSYYVFDQKMAGKPALGYNDWERQTDDPTMILYYNMSKKDPKFKQFLMEYQKSGAANINMTPGERKLDEAKVAGQAYFLQPDKVMGDLQSYIGSQAGMDAIDANREEAIKLPKNATPQQQSEAYKAADARALAKTIYEWYVKNIKTAGKILNERAEGNTIVWTVKWDNGNTSEVRHEF